MITADLNSVPFSRLDCISSSSRLVKPFDIQTFCWTKWRSRTDITTELGHSQPRAVYVVLHSHGFVVGTSLSSIYNHLVSVNDSLLLWADLGLDDQNPVAAIQTHPNTQFNTDS